MSIALLVMLWAAQGQTVNGLPVPDGCRLEHIVTAEGTAINTKLCGDGNGETRKLDPVDVPAVQGRRAKFSAPCADRLKVIKNEKALCLSSYYEGVDYVYWRDGDLTSLTCEHRDEVRQIPNCRVASGWTCADKSRVLLTSEDGAKHCIKFGVER